MVENRRTARPQWASALDDTLHMDLAAATAQVARSPFRFAVLFERGDVTVELLVPRGRDSEATHGQDELYIVASGSGMFRRGDSIVPFACGDALFVPAGADHRFESFTEDFRTWVIFFGPPGGNDAASDREAPFSG